MRTCQGLHPWLTFQHVAQLTGCHDGDSDPHTHTHTHTYINCMRVQMINMPVGKSGIDGFDEKEHADRHTF